MFLNDDKSVRIDEILSRNKVGVNRIFISFNDKCNNITTIVKRWKNESIASIMVGESIKINLNWEDYSLLSLKLFSFFILTL